MLYSAAMRLLAIVPALDEARSLASLLAAMRAALPDAEICVVDDGSTDDTAGVAARAGATVLRLPVNLGIGGAVQAGYRLALERRVDAAVQLDGDGQHDPAQVARLLEPLARGEADLVVGSRFLAAGGFRSSAVRRAGIRYLCWFLRLRCGARTTDPTSGFRAAGRRAIALFARAYPSDYPEPESLAVAWRSHLAVREVPVTMRDRAHGASSITPWRTLYYLVKVTVALLFLPRRPPEPGPVELHP